MFKHSFNSFLIYEVEKDDELNFIIFSHLKLWIAIHTFK